VQVFAAPAVGDVEVLVHRDSLTPKVQGLGTRCGVSRGCSDSSLPLKLEC
jgi:hypothetical protein